MLLSLIIPVYNVAPYLDRCLKSVLQQGVANMEVILVDDASPDRSPAICDEWSRRYAHIRTIHCPTNGGLSAARNVGLDAATGQYIAFFDSDDFLRPATLAKALATLQAEASADVVEFPIVIHHGSPRASLYLPWPSGTPACISFEEWINAGGHAYCYAVNKIYRRTLWTEKRFPVGRLFEDTLTIPFVLEQARGIVRTNEGAAVYCENASSISQQTDRHTLEERFATSLTLYTHLLDNAQRFSPAALDRCYLALLNAAISLRAAGGSPVLEQRHVSLSSLSSGTSIVGRTKAILNNVIGSRNLISIFAKIAR